MAITRSVFSLRLGNIFQARFSASSCDVLTAMPSLIGRTKRKLATRRFPIIVSETHSDRCKMVAITGLSLSR